MGFIKQRVNTKVKNTTVTGKTLTNAQILETLGVENNNEINSHKLGETTLFTCLKHLSECVGKLPVKAYTKVNGKGKEVISNFRLDYLLNVEPNPYMTASSFWQSVELNRNYHGNSFVYIDSSNGNTSALWILPSDQVDLMMDNAGLFGTKNALWYRWLDSTTAKNYLFSADEILHFKSSMSFDGVTGMSFKQILWMQINSRKYSDKYLHELYKNKMMGNKVLLYYTGDLNPDREKELTTGLERYSTSVGTGKFIPLPLGITAQNLDMKLSDSEFAELNKMSKLDLAACFGIKPNIINDYSKSSYSNSETQQLDFYVNSLLPILRQYNQENTRKLLFQKEKQSNIILEFDNEELFKMDNKSLMEYVKEGTSNFLMSINEGREKLGLPWREDSDVLIGNGATIKLDQIGIQYTTKGGVNDNGTDIETNK